MQLKRTIPPVAMFFIRDNRSARRSSLSGKCLLIVLEAKAHAHPDALTVEAKIRIPQHEMLAVDVPVEIGLHDVVAVVTYWALAYIAIAANG